MTNALWSSPSTKSHKNSRTNSPLSFIGGQAVQMAKAGLQAIYMSGWQVAADANTAAQTFPDQSLYPADSAPRHVARINNSLTRADQIAKLERREQHLDFFLPIVADAEAGFGGALNAYELMRNMVSFRSFLQIYVLYEMKKKSETE